MVKIGAGAHGHSNFSWLRNFQDSDVAQTPGTSIF